MAGTWQPIFRNVLRPKFHFQRKLSSRRSRILVLAGTWQPIFRDVPRVSAWLAAFADDVFVCCDPTSAQVDNAVHALIKILDAEGSPLNGTLCAAARMKPACAPH